MATNTPNYNLVKPTKATDTADIDVINSNMDIIDAALATKAPLASPDFTGTPKVPTATAGTNTTQAASTAFVTAAVSAIPAITWTNITGKPTTFPPSAHGHAATEITATGSTTVQAEIDSLKSSVSSGKNTVAAAITGKNQAASGTDTFAQLAAKINAILAQMQQL